MGQYLKQQYEERDLARTLAKVHGIIDEETQELSDKLKNLKLSHNRMRNLLKQILAWLDSGCLPEDFYEDVKGSGTFLFSGLKEVEYFHRRITLELYGLENYKGLKGGKRCV